jgi:hypothetical protein
MTFKEGNIIVPPNDINFSTKAEQYQIDDYLNQFKLAVDRSWGEYWPDYISDAVKESGLLEYIANTSADIVTILGFKKIPRLDLICGLNFGKINHTGFNFEFKGENWVVLEENWLDSLAQFLHDTGPCGLSQLKDQIDLTIAEEVFHAFIREINPKMTSISEDANASANRGDYYNDIGERLAKKFALSFIQNKENNISFSRLDFIPQE